MHHINRMLQEAAAAHQEGQSIHRRSRKNKNGEHLSCVFCKNNGEASFIYSSHNLKDELGNVSCPVLREYKCPNCGAHGDKAHTLKYCPLSTSTESLGAVKTARTSTGKRRSMMPAGANGAVSAPVNNPMPERLGRRPPPSTLMSPEKLKQVVNQAMGKI